MEERGNVEMEVVRRGGEDRGGVNSFLLLLLLAELRKGVEA